MKNFVRLEPVPNDVTELFPKIIQYMDNLKTSAYKNLVNVNFQQYDITSFLNKVPQGKRAKASNATPMKAFERYFRNIALGIFNCYGYITKITVPFALGNLITSLYICQFIA